MTTTRVAVVTGASSGIGKEAAKTLAAWGWRVIALGRDPDRTAAAAAEIRAVATAPFDMLRADLALIADAERTADEIAALADRVDVLLNNAGGVAAQRRITREGNEATFSGNHLGQFHLTNRLLPLLRAAVADAPAGSVRIINTSSRGHVTAPGFDWNDPQMLDGWTSGGSYCNAKLANILHARALARRLAKDGIVVHSLHPGTVASNFVAHADEDGKAYFRTLDARPPEEAADTLIWLATAEEPGRSTGGYYYQREQVPTTAAAEDEALGERLWAESEQLVARSLGR